MKEGYRSVFEKVRKAVERGLLEASVRLMANNTCLFVTVLAFCAVVPPPILQFRQLPLLYEGEHSQVDPVPVCTDDSY
jgi:hypothetical protein